MKLAVCWTYYGCKNYSIVIIDDTGVIRRQWDKDIAKYLDLTLEQYQKILQQNNVIFEDAVKITRCKKDHYFKNESDANLVIEKLTPYMFMVQFSN